MYYFESQSPEKISEQDLIGVDYTIVVKSVWLSWLKILCQGLQPIKDRSFVNRRFTLKDSFKSGNSKPSHRYSSGASPIHAR